MFYIMNTQKIININGFTCTRINKYYDNLIHFFRNLKNRKSPKEYKWEKVYISFQDMHFWHRTKIYEVFLTEDNPRYKYVIKPAKRIKSLEFEQIFGFGPDCINYNEKRMIGLYKRK